MIPFRCSPICTLALLCLCGMAPAQTPSSEVDPQRRQMLLGRWWSLGGSGTIVDFYSEGRLRVCRADQVVKAAYEWMSPSLLRVTLDQEGDAAPVSVVMTIELEPKRLACQVPGGKAERFERR